jgi:hypothetical protein
MQRTTEGEQLGWRKMTRPSMKVSQAIYNRILALVALVFQTIPSVRVVIFTAQLGCLGLFFSHFTQQY